MRKCQKKRDLSCQKREKKKISKHFCASVYIFKLSIRSFLTFPKSIFLSEKCEAFSELIIKNRKICFRKIK